MASGGSFGLLMLDVDNFKRYNDRYGHQAGDDCLRAVARALQAAVGEGACRDAFPARYGGEEFAVVMPNAGAEEHGRMAASIVEAVRASAIQHVENDGLGVVTASVGGARLEVARDRLVDLFRMADARLYRAKKEGRNRAVLLG